VTVGSKNSVSRETYHLSGDSVLLFTITLLVLFSGFTGYRVSVFGLLVHPYLVPVGCLLPILIGWRIKQFPARPLAAILVFVCFYVFSTLGGSGASSEIIKISAAVMTVVTAALLVQQAGDFVAGTTGLSIAVSVLAVRAIQSESGVVVVEAFDSANKNTYSLYALPPLLLAGFVCLKMPNVSKILKILLALGSLITLAAIFMSANRSGYVGAVVVGLMLLWSRKLAGFVFVFLISAALVFGLLQYGNVSVFKQRLEQTQQGTQSDELRIDIIKACVIIGLENPIVGVSPQELAIAIGRRLPMQYHLSMIGSHNVFAHIWAGSGLFCFGALAYLGYSLFFWQRPGESTRTSNDFFVPSRQLLRMILVLWAIRGAFTNEILYSPSFCLAIGLAIGLCSQSITAAEVRSRSLVQPYPVV
jgi:hypothetical protein